MPDISTRYSIIDEVENTREKKKVPSFLKVIGVCILFAIIIFILWKMMF